MGSETKHEVESDTGTDGEYESEGSDEPIR